MKSKNKSVFQADLQTAGRIQNRTDLHQWENNEQVHNCEPARFRMTGRNRKVRYYLAKGLRWLADKLYPQKMEAGNKFKTA